MEEVSVAGVAHDRDQAKLTVQRRARPARDRGAPSSARSPRASIVVDMIIQNVSADGTTDLTFTVPRSDYDKARALAETIARAIGAQGVRGQTRHRQGVGRRHRHAHPRRHRGAHVRGARRTRASTSR